MKVHIIALVVAVVLPFTGNAYEGESYKLIKFTDTKNKQQVVSTLNRYGYSLVETLEQIHWHVAVADAKNGGDEKGLKSDPRIQHVESNGLIKLNLQPNDDDFNKLDGMALINAEAAWDITVGSNSVVVAVSDTGIDLDHPDLAANMWVNADEIPNNDIDDDQNGFVDDVHGYDFNGNDGNPDDDNMHGSHVAGTIGAVGNNSKGVVGVNWKVRLMAVKFLSAQGSGSDLNGVKTILYAVDNGANVINASWGGGDPSQAFVDALNYAADNNVLFVAAAGNSSENTDSKPHYPSNYHYLPSVISVASATHNGNRSDFSNYGATTVHLAAPGSDIYSTIHRGRYRSLSGTSMATPHVAGLAALILSVSPDLSVTDLRNAILNAVTTSEKWQGKVSTGGYIEAHKALVQLEQGPQVWPGQLRIKRGLTHKFSAYAITGPVTWSTSNEELATIDEDGVLTAHAPGQVQVMAATANGAWVTKDIQVGAPASGGCGRPGSSTDEHAAAGFTTTALLMLPMLIAGTIRRRVRRRRTSR